MAPASLTTCVERFGPAIDEALERVSPAVEAARGKMSGEILPKLSEALSAAAGTPVVVEMKKRGKAAVAAAKGELELPEEKKKKSRWFLWLLLAAGVAGVAVILIRKFLGSKDADWQAARPTTPYGSTKPTETADAAGTAGTAAAAPVVDEMDDSGEDPQSGQSAHLYNLEADGEAFPDQPAEGGDIDEGPADLTTPVDEGPADLTTPVDEAPADMTTRVDEAFAEAAANIGVEAPAEATSVGEETSAETTTVDESLVGTTAADEALVGQAPVGDEGALLGETVAAPEARRSYEGEGVYVGSEPPDGFTIKGNQRSMKYHVPESAGYSRTVAEVWFNSEEAAQQAGFVRAQR